MQATAIISGRGQITLPISLRQKYGLTGETPILIEDTDEGILLKKINFTPVKVYSDEEIKGYLDQDKILPRDKKWVK